MVKRKTIHDKRPYYNRRRVPLQDQEWEEAERSNQKPQYYWCSMFNGGKCVRCYKPQVAEVVKKRTGWKMTQIIQDEDDGK